MAVERPPVAPWARGVVVVFTGLAPAERLAAARLVEEGGGSSCRALRGGAATHLLVAAPRGAGRGAKLEHARAVLEPRGLIKVVDVAWLEASRKAGRRLDEGAFPVRDDTAALSERDELHDEQAQLALEDHIALQDELALNAQLAEARHDAEGTREAPSLPFAGVRAFVDGGIPDAEAVRASICAGGGAVLESCHIGSGCTHVVCDVGGLRGFLKLDVSLVSPLWVATSLARGCPQRAPSLSTDLRDALDTVVGQQATQHSPSSQRSGFSATGERAAAAGDRPATDAAAVRQHEAEVARVEVAARKAAAGTAAWLRPIAPAALAEGVSWAVTEPVSTARVHEGAAGDDLRALTAAELSAPLPYRLPFLAVVFPLDRFNELVGTVEHIRVDPRAGLTLEALLEAVREFYARPLTAEETMLAMRTSSKYADLLRKAHASGEPTARGAFLGSRKAFEGLRRVGAQLFELSLVA